jgi:hypothetical protein
VNRDGGGESGGGHVTPVTVLSLSSPLPLVVAEVRVVWKGLRALYECQVPRLST